MIIQFLLSFVVVFGGENMKVYLKNQEGKQTVRDLPLLKAFGLRFYVFARYWKEDRPIVRFVI